MPSALSDKVSENWNYCKEILPQVSRTFALNITHLEGDIYKAVLLGYLLFRIADTFEDNTFQNEADKISDLCLYSSIFKGNKSLAERLELYQPLKFRWEEESPDKNLIENGDKVINYYFEIQDIYRKIIDLHIARTSQGMLKFQKRKLESKLAVFQLKNIDDLKDYCYQVAGIVGEMLTQIFYQRKAISSIKIKLEKHQTAFGLALQLTNIIKDFQKDLKRGWCYIPVSITQKYSISINDMFNLSIARKKEIVDELKPFILNIYNSSLEYIKAIPKNEKEIRMFCIIPFVLAYNTFFHIVRMKGKKLSRGQVAAILNRCDSYAASNQMLEKDYLKIHNKLR